MAIDYQVLYNDMTTGPLKDQVAPMLTNGDCAGIANLYNSPSPTISVADPIVPLNELLIWGASGVQAKLRDFSDDKANDGPLRSMCYSSLNVLFGAAPYFDLSNPKLNNPDRNNPGMLQILSGVNTAGAGGTPVIVISQQDMDALLALGVKSPASQAEQLFGVNTTLTHEDISQAIAVGGG